MPTSERVGKNEALFREVNERIKDVSVSLVAFDGETPLQFVCECSDEACNEPVQVTLAEYEAVRSEPTHFLIVRGHVWEPKVERVVHSGEGFAVLEKVGAAGDVAADGDPR